jgi:hypothetical protein
MGQHHFAKCWTDESSLYQEHAGGLTIDGNPLTLKDTEFKICKKGHIQQQKIEIEMMVMAHIQDYDLLDNLDALYFSVDLGESYERDKFKWTVKNGGPGGVLLDEEIRKKLEFNFKMNHIKQTVRFI